MAYFYQEPQTVEQLLSFVAKWAAENLYAKVEVTVEKTDGSKITETYDRRRVNR